MKGVQLQLNGAKASLDFSAPISGFRATAQNSLVGFITERAAIDLFEDRGTTLFSSAVTGAIVDGASAKHACAFAANDTLFFARSTEDPTDPDSLQDFLAQPVGVEAGRLSVRISLRSTGGEQFNTLI